MLGIILLALGCHLVGSIMLIIGLVTTNRRWQRLGTGLILSVTVGLIGLAVAEHQPFTPLFRSRSVRGFK